MNENDIRKALYELYDLKEVELFKMAGYDSLNYKVQSRNKRYVLKIYRNTDLALLHARAENEVMKNLGPDQVEIPKPVPNKYNSYFSEIDNTDLVFRLLTFLEGDFLAEVEHSEELIESLGEFLARLDVQLLNLRHPVIESKHITWDLEHLIGDQHLRLFITNRSDQKIVDYFLNQWQTFVIDKIPLLRRSLIHNDANDWNVLTQNGRVSGIIDFGDMVYSRLIYELAVAACYLAIEKPDPLPIICQLISAYHKILPLRTDELNLLYYLIAGRLCTSVLNSARSKLEHPENDYISISEKGAWNLLRKWITINPEAARSAFLKSIGILPEKKNVSLIALRDKYIPKVLSVSYDRPIHMMKGAFQYMYDQNGNTILDAYNNIIHVGHCHPHVVRAGQKAMATLNTNTRYLYTELTDYAAHLLSYFPPGLNKVFLVNSGSAAGDLAIRLARTFTKRKNIAVLEHGYHGNSSLGISMSHYKYAHKGGEGRDEHTIELTMPDAYRGLFQEEHAGEQYAHAAIKKLASQGNGSVAAFIAEPIIGCGGQVPLPPNYLKELYAYVHSIGGVCISDEVQTGFGRLGKWFWGFEMHEVEPDIVVLGKPIGNGHPMAAVVTNSEIAQAFNNGMEFFSSFGGNPVSCSIGKAVLEVLENESLPAHAALTGEFLVEELEKLQSRYDVIGDIRGAGFFLGIDLVKDKKDKVPHKELATTVINELREMNILTSLDGPGANVLKIKPPLCFDKTNVSTLITALDQVLSKNA